MRLLGTAYRLKEIIGLIVLLGLCMVMIASTSKNTLAATNQCNVIISIDKSGSISDTQWQTMGVNIQNILYYGITGVSNLKIAVWTFSHGNPTSDYNSPHSNGYVEAGVVTSTQRDMIRTIFGVDNFRVGPQTYITRDGGTDYQQAFGYSSDPYGGGVVRLNPAIGNIADGQPSAFILVTDGAPNYPGGLDGNSGLDNNNDAMSAARSARSKYAVPAYGAFVTEPQSSRVPLGLAYTMNGPSDEVGPVDYGGIGEFISRKIATACGISTPPPPPLPPQTYNLMPELTINSTEVSKTRPYASLIPTVENKGVATSEATKSEIFEIVTNRNPSGRFTGPYVEATDDGECDWLVNTLPQGTSTDNWWFCSKKSDFSDERSFGAGQKVNVAVPFGVYQVQTPANSPDVRVGDYICYLLRITKPTQNDAPKYRFSNPACALVVPPPYNAFVQIWGGDLRAGGKVDGAKPYGRTGSWVEYGIFANGIVKLVSSNSGFRYGYGGSDAVCGPYSALTFANADGECGNFSTSYDGSVNIVSILQEVLPGRTITGSKLDADAINATSTGNEIQLRNNSFNRNITIEDADPIQIKKGKTILVDVSGDVTIAQDIVYEDEYDNTGDIPQLIIHAGGNIIIKDNVTTVDAWLIADERITTCDKREGGNEYTGGLKLSICNKQLTVHGPISTDKLHLRRTAHVDGASGESAEVLSLRGSEYLWAYDWALRHSNTSVLRTTYQEERPPYF